VSAPSVIAYVSLHGHEYRLVRRSDEEDDEPILVIERRTTDALDVVCWSAVVSTTTFSVLEAYALGVGVRLPEAPRIGEGLGDVLRDLASWCDRHGVKRTDAYNASVVHPRWDPHEAAVHVEAAAWLRLAAGREAERIRGEHRYITVDGVEIVAIFDQLAPVVHGCTTPGCLEGEACAVVGGGR
jgi:hypothetical protein